MKLSLIGVSALALALNACGPVRPEDRFCQIERMGSDKGETSAQEIAFFPEGFAEELRSNECGSVGLV
ncbi:MAG: hypothetical protein HRT56_09010 [Coraliomargarita sp.]|nr:hypothetical protein [Coraliomargarita sp.]